MHRSVIFLLFVSAGIHFNVSGQKSAQRSFGEYWIADSSSTLMFPTLYQASLFTSNKVMEWNVYANIIFYDFKTDSIRRLFKEDTYIAEFSRHGFYDRIPKLQLPFSSDNIFYRCFTTDTNRNGKIDHHDPAILYMSDRHGKNLAALTSEDQNVVSFEIFDKQGFVLVKIQRDVDNNGRFESSTDDEYYFVKFDLKTKRFGPAIEVL